MTDLEKSIAGFQQAMRKWPEGLLLGEAWADLPQCEQMKKDVKVCKRMEGAEAHREILDTFETRVNIQIGHLKAEEGKCFC